MSAQRILLVEPKARTSYPPMGLMKIAAYHHLHGDEVHYASGKDSKYKEDEDGFDKIYITSVFTYNYSSLLDTIIYYTRLATADTKICVGGIAATLLSERLTKDLESGPLEGLLGGQSAEDPSITLHKGLLNQEDSFLVEIAEHNPQFRYLKGRACVDNLAPYYGLFPKDSKYQKFLNRAYFFFATKGCPNKCGFCAVKTLEPKYENYIPLKPRIEQVIRTSGQEKPGLLLLDNNIAASESYFRIIDEIKDCGFSKGAKLIQKNNNRAVCKKRFVDFNQGVDLRLMDEAKMTKMGEIAIAPLRLAFDDVSLTALYEEKMNLAIDCGITELSNYMLYNYKDTPADLYARFEVNLRILEQRAAEGVKIFSFPMRYSPIERIDRKYVGKHWTKRYVRAVQLVLQATHGIVSHKLPFFSRAFGRDQEQFHRILLYPYNYIINRDVVEYETGLLEQWNVDYTRLTPNETNEFKEIVKNGPMNELPATRNGRIRTLLEHYEGERAQIMKKGEFTLYPG